MTDDAVTTSQTWAQWFLSFIPASAPWWLKPAGAGVAVLGAALGCWQLWPSRPDTSEQFARELKQTNVALAKAASKKDVSEIHDEVRQLGINLDALTEKVLALEAKPTPAARVTTGSVFGRRR